MSSRRINLGIDVFSAALERMVELYAAPQQNRILIAFSAGKDSGVCLEICKMAHQIAGRTDPVEVAMRDEEIMYPGTFEYAERVAQQPNVKFHWLIAGQPIVNIYNRVMPYFWVFDPLLKPEQWMRRPPAWATWIEDKDIGRMINPDRFPPSSEFPVMPLELQQHASKLTEEQKSERRKVRKEQIAYERDPSKARLITVMGIRVQESPKRKAGIYASKGYLTGSPVSLERNARPIYDWTDSDVWLAVKRYGWDYNDAYDVLSRMGIPKHRLRIAPPTITVIGASSLQKAAQAWPRWFDKLCERLPGVRQAVNFGWRACWPERRLGESWEETFWRENVTNAPKWIADRSLMAKDMIMKKHKSHSTLPLPDAADCVLCGVGGMSWRKLCTDMYLGDPFAMYNPMLPYVEPEFFREGAGTWNGKPTF